LDDLDLNAIPDDNARQLVRRRLNRIEHLSADLRDAQAENQRLRDENNRLKGEHGQSKLMPNTLKPPPSDYSSQKERRQPRQRHKRSKKAVIAVNREQVVEVDRATLPADAEFKGYEDVVVQDLLLKTDNVCFHKQKYYAPSTGQTYLAQLPSGYEGQFGPGVKALSLALYFGLGASEPKIVEFFQHVGLQIWDGEVSNRLIKDQDGFHAEKEAPGGAAALGSTPMTPRRGSMGPTSPAMWCAIRSLPPTTPSRPRTA